MLYHVTDITGLAGGYAGVSAEVLQRAAQMGIEVHRFGLCYASLGHVPIAVPAEINPYLLRFQEWFDNHVTEVAEFKDKKAVELRIQMPTHHLTGRIDLIARLKGDRGWSLIDLKRVATVLPTVGMQLAAYQHLAEWKLKIKIARRIALHIPKEGKCRAVEFSSVNDLAAFWNAWSLYTYLHSIGAVTPREEN